MKKFKGLNKQTTKLYSDGVNFAINLAKQLHLYGIPSHRLEDSMLRLCKKLNLNIEFMVHSGVIFASIQEGDKQHNLILKPEKQEVDLNKLCQLDELALKVIQHEYTTSEGLKRLRKIEKANSAYPKWLDFLAFGLSSASAAVLFGGSWAQILVATIIGFIVGGLILATSRLSAIGKLLPLSASFIASFIAISGQDFLGNYSLQIPTITGLIVLIPGYSFTVSMIELASGHNVSGTSRFMSSLITFLMLAFGLALGNTILDYDGSNISTDFPSPNEVFNYISMAIIPLTFCILFKAPIKYYPYLLFSCIFAYYGMIYGNDFLGKDMGLFIASLALGIGANLLARIFNKPAVLIVVPGFMLLVPGSVGFKSINSLLRHETLQGI